MRELLEVSRTEKKTVTLYLTGLTIIGGVTKVAGNVVELRNREFARIMVKIDAIDAIAMA